MAEHERRRNRAALTIQIELYRSWKARKRIREMVHRRFRKKFDPEYHTCYYENVRSVATFAVGSRASVA